MDNWSKGSIQARPALKALLAAVALTAAAALGLNLEPDWTWRQAPGQANSIPAEPEAGLSPDHRPTGKSTPPANPPDLKSLEKRPAIALGLYKVVESGQPDYSTLDQWMSRNLSSYQKDLMAIECIGKIKTPPPAIIPPGFDQLKLRTFGQNPAPWAILEDRHGNSHIVHQGGRLGYHSWRITNISGSSLTVEELSSGPDRPARVAEIRFEALSTPPGPSRPTDRIALRDRSDLPAAEAIGLFGQSVDLKAGNPEHAPIFAALNQWMRRNMAAYNYDRTALRDPFAWKDILRRGPPPRPPVPSILRWNVIEYKLVAITRLKDSRVWASFEDRQGNSYILREGNRIGCNNGRVKTINDLSVTVEEPGPEPTSPNRILEIKGDPRSFWRTAS